MLTKLPQCIKMSRSKTLTISQEVNSTVKEKEENVPHLGQRHLVAFMGFIFGTTINIHRMTMGVAIVAMVKHTNPTQTHNSSEVFCPMRWQNETSTKRSAMLQGELDWNSEMQGLVLGAGFLGFCLSIIPGGRLSETWGAKRTLLAGNTLAGLFTIISPSAAHWNVYAMIAIQLLRGIAQGPIYAGLFILMANWFPRRERGFLAPLVMCGFAVGGVIGAIVTGWVCDLPSLGWQWSFYIFGIYSVAFSLIFACIYHETPQDHPGISEKELKYITKDQEMDVSEKRPPVPWKKILTSVPVYALIVGHFGHFWADGYFLSVHPTYMGSILHFPITENGALSSLPLLMKSVGGIAASVATKWIYKRNWIGVDQLRKICNSVGAAGYSLCLLGVYFAGCDIVINMLCFSLSLFCSGISLSGTMVAAGDMSPTFAGTLIGIGCGLGSLSLVILPVIVGNMTQHETPSEWYNVFLLSSVIVFVCGLVFWIFGSANVQPWNYPEDERPTKISVIDSKDSNNKTKQ